MKPIRFFAHGSGSKKERIGKNNIFPMACEESKREIYGIGGVKLAFESYGRTKIEELERQPAFLSANMTR